MNNIPHNLPYDNRLARMRKRLQGLQRVAAAINDLYIYGKIISKKSRHRNKRS